MLVNLEHVKALVTAQEALVLNPLHKEVAPFVSKLKKVLQSPGVLPSISFFSLSAGENSTLGLDAMNHHAAQPPLPSLSSSTMAPGNPPGSQSDLPFEFVVLELILEAALLELESSTKELVADATSAMEEFRRNVSTESLEKVRSAKARMTRLTARVQNVPAFCTLVIAIRFCMK